jgi:hypothetical protein
MQEDHQRRIVEINGVKLEVDMRYARKVEEMRVGSKVKVLIKEYGDNFKVCPGVIIGFEEFDKLPTIVVAYLESSWSSADIKFMHYNAATKDKELAAAVTDEIELNHADALAAFDREITKKQRELADLQEKRTYFERNFGTYWNLKVPQEA